MIQPSDEHNNTLGNGGLFQPAQNRNDARDNATQFALEEEDDEEPVDNTQE